MARRIIQLDAATREVGGGPAFRTLLAIIEQNFKELFASISGAINPHQVTTSSYTATATDAAIAIVRASPSTTTITLPAVASRSGLLLMIFDWSTGVTNHAITINPSAGETIMRQASWVLYSNADSLASVKLQPSTALNGWFIAP